MFTKRPTDYYYDQDALRVPLAQAITPASIMGHGVPFKQGVIRGQDFRTMTNPMGRVEGAVWHLPNNYTGDHSAAFSEEFVRRCLVTCCPRAVVSSIRMSALAQSLWSPPRLGMQVTGVDLNPHYIEEAKQRVLADHAQPVKPTAQYNPGVANDNLASAMRAGD